MTQTPTDILEPSQSYQELLIQNFLCWLLPNIRAYEGYSYFNNLAPTFPEHCHV